MARHEVEALWALASGELDAEARARVEAHVASCGACAQRLVEVGETRNLLRVAREEPTTVRWAKVDDRVLSMAARRFGQREHRSRGLWMLAAMGACVTTLSLLMLGPGTAPRVEVGPPTPWVREADGTERALQADSGLRAGSTVKTPARGSARLRLPDASGMLVSADSEVVLSRVSADDVHLRVMRGRVAVRASHAERRGFIVEAEGLRVFVVGTVFSVERTPAGPAVSVLEGRVRVEAEGLRPGFATAGQRVELHSNERTWRQLPLSIEDQRAFEALGVQVTPPAIAEPPAPPDPPAPERSTTAPRKKPVSTPTPVAPGEPETRSSPAGTKDAAEPPRTSPLLSEGGSLTAEQEWQRFPAPREVEERFLSHARTAVDTRGCESFLVGLEEIAEESRERPLREEARYLRARCFEARLSPAQATAEYRLYLKEFPHGRWSEEARGSLSP
ncbi:FecR domain-containing protein [Archangium violaceum]|uniref:FecR domain-containing protein n=1 Tax=Archangium violaceum TaxID=83451 RepID=UPI00193BBE41|nr:FecR domain-containing protein [Archangium violaceum]QRK08107.1 FecR domain-containing protein [Archangium violaceum]